MTEKLIKFNIRNSYIFGYLNMEKYIITNIRKLAEMTKPYIPKLSTPIYMYK